MKAKRVGNLIIKVQDVDGGSITSQSVEANLLFEILEILKSAQQKFALDEAICSCKLQIAVIGDNHAKDCALHYPPRQ